MRASKLGLKVRKTDVGAQMIDESSLPTYGMVIASFQVQNQLDRLHFFQETFLLADTSMDVILGMPFLTLGNADIHFTERELTWRSPIPLQKLYRPPDG